MLAFLAFGVEVAVLVADFFTGVDVAVVVAKGSVVDATIGASGVEVAIGVDAESSPT